MQHLTACCFFLVINESCDHVNAELYRATMPWLMSLVLICIRFSDYCAELHRDLCVPLFPAG